MANYEQQSQEILQKWLERLGRAGEDQQKIAEVLRDLKDEASFLGRMSQALWSLHKGVSDIQRLEAERKESPPDA